MNPFPPPRDVFGAQEVALVHHVHAEQTSTYGNADDEGGHERRDGHHNGLSTEQGKPEIQQKVEECFCLDDENNTKKKIQ
jgi:hypothetical protein